MGTTPVNFRLPEDLLRQADVAAEVTHRNRTEVVIEALREYLDSVEDDEAFRETVVDLYLDDEIGDEALEAVVGTQDAAAVRSSKELLERGEEIVGDLAER